MRISLKRVGASELDGVKQLIYDAFTVEPWFDDWSDSEQFRRYILDLACARNSLSIAGYDEDGALVAASLGRVVHWYEGTQYWIDDFAVAPGAQRRGVGSAFMSALGDYLITRGITGVGLLTDRNIPADFFYRKNGFREVPNRILMTKELKSREPDDK